MNNRDGPPYWKADVARTRLPIEVHRDCELEQKIGTTERQSKEFLIPNTSAKGPENDSNLCLNFGIEVITEEHQYFRSFFRCQRLFNLCSVNNTLSPEMKSFILISNFPICPTFTVSEQERNNESKKISVNYIFKNKL